MIYTFYSYKGGAGRSMALANVAQWFYLQGLRVVIIDWDLEAPGLENFFFTSEKDLENVRCQIGLIDMLMAYKRKFSRLPLLPQNNENEILAILQENLAPISDMFYPIYPQDLTTRGKSGGLWLIPAGLRYREHISAYARNVQDFDWADFYTSFCGKAYFDWMRTSLLAPTGPADVVLIDSRTGITEMGGVCTRQLADVVVSFCVPNLQNLAGVATMVESFQRKELLQERDDRVLQAVVVPARLDSSEVDARNHFQSEFIKNFDALTPLAFKKVGRTFWHLKIPYIPKYAYMEILSIGALDGAEELEEAYKNLAASLILFFPENSHIRKRFNSELRRLSIFAKRTPRVFISYTYADGADLAKMLRRRLEEEEISPWADLAVLEDENDSWLQTTDALDRVEFMIPIVTPMALRSPIFRKEWRYARQQGVCIFPVKDHLDIDLNDIPRWMSSIHWYDIRYEWQKFINDLNSTCEQPRVPFMVGDLPTNFIPRPKEFDMLISKILDERREEPIAVTTALRGAGGFGKTTLAKAICHDGRIQDVFDDGILWVTIGEHPEDLIGKIEDLIYVISNEKPGFAGLEAASSYFTELLADRDILFVIDDVWDIAHLTPFLQGGKRCARIITTRNEGILPYDTLQILIGAMDQTESLQLLCTGFNNSNFTKKDEVKMLNALCDRLGGWPLLLALANGVLYGRVSKGQPLKDALAFVTRTLDRRGLTAFDAKNPQDRSQAVEISLRASLDFLSPKEYECYRELVIFPEDINIPLEALQKLWGIADSFDEFDTENLCHNLYSLSLLSQYNLAARTIRIHDIIRSYLQQNLEETSSSHLHRLLLDAYRCKRWADLPPDEPYMWDHLAEHLIAAHRVESLIVTVKDLRYLAIKTLVRDVCAMEADLTLAEEQAPIDGSLHLLKRNIVNISHLLKQTKLFNDLATVLYSRLNHLKELSILCQALRPEISQPFLMPWHPLPDLSSPLLIRTLAGYNGGINGCAISPDGQWIVSCSDDETLKLWDTLTGKERFTLHGHTKVVSGCAISPDGQWIVSCSDDETLMLWDAFTGKERLTLHGHTKAVNSCAVSPGGDWIVSASEDQTLKVWDAHTSRERLTLHGHTKAVNSCAISPDGQWIVSCSDDETLMLWDALTRQAFAILSGHTNAVNGCTISPDGQWIVSCSDDETLKLWDVFTGQERATLLGHANAVNGCAISLDGQWIVSCSDDKTLKLWDTQAETELPILRDRPDEVNSCVALLKKNLAVAALRNGNIKLWDVRTGTECQILYGHNGHTEAVNACAVSPVGDWIVSASDDKTLKVWDAQTGRERFTLYGHQNRVRGCAIVPDGNYIVSASDDKTLKIWDAQTGEEHRTLYGHTKAVNGCAVSPMGDWIVSASDDKTLKVWDAYTGKERLTLYGHTDWVNGCMVSPDGRYIISASQDGTIKLWDIKTGKLHTTFQENDSGVNSCAISPSGRYIISASCDHKLKLWDTSTGRCLSTLLVEGDLYSCTFYNDDAHLLAGGKFGLYFLQLT